MTNETMQAILGRRSVRRYLDQALTQGELEILTSAALQAPSARNLQPNHLRVVTDRQTLLEMDADYRRVSDSPAGPNGTFFHGAPALLLVFGLDDQYYTPVDGGILVENMALAAQSIGLGSCIIGCVRALLNAPQGTDWYSRLHVPAGCHFVIGLAVGRPAEHPAAKPRDPSRIEIL